MKLKDDYILYNASDVETIAVATGDEAENFNGLLRANETAGSVLEYLKEETTAEEIVKRMLEEYDASEEDIRAGITDVLNSLRSIGALEE